MDGYHRFSLVVVGQAAADGPVAAVVDSAEAASEVSVAEVEAEAEQVVVGNNINSLLN